MRNATDQIFQATIIFCLENRERSFTVPNAPSALS